MSEKPPAPEGDSSTDDGYNVVEYRSYQPLPPPVSSAGVSADNDDWLKAHLSQRTDLYGWYQRYLGRARIGATYAEYIYRSMIWGAVGVLVGACLIGLLLVLSATAIGGPADRFLPAATMIVIGGIVTGGITVGGYLLYPWYHGQHRRTQIDALLPNAVVYMRAVAYIDPNPVDLVREVAEYESIYGELAREFEAIRRDVEVYQDDLLTALQNADDFVPSERLREFLDDLSSLLESGGDVADFLDHEVESQLELTERRLEDLLETLETLAPVYVIAIGIGPVIFLVTLLVLSIVGADVTALLFILTYGFIPLAVVASMLLIELFTNEFRLQTGRQIQIEDELFGQEEPESPEQWYVEYHQSKVRKQTIDRIIEPIRTMQKSPVLSLWLTIPLALLVVLLLNLLDFVSVSAAAMTAQPIRTTTGIIVVPLFIVSIPLMILHELKIRRDRQFEERFPDALYSLANVNERGVPLLDGIELIARRYEGPIAEEFSKTHRDAQLDHDLTRALTALANRHRLPRITMAVSVLRRVVQSTERVGPSLQALARDLDMRLSLEKKRRQEMQLYAVVVSLGVFVYLLIVIVLDAYFLPLLPEAIDQPVLGAGEDASLERFRMIFFHSSLLLAAGGGLLMGKLIDDSLSSGLKFVNGFVIVVLASFLLSGMF